MPRLALTAAILIAIVCGCTIVELGRPADLEVIDIGTVEDLRGIDLVESAGWLCGPSPYQDAEAVVYYQTNDQWDGIVGPTGDLADIQGDGAGGCTAVGAAGLLTVYDGSDWNRRPNLTSADLSDVCADGDDLWVVGRDGAVLRRTAGVWSLLDPGVDDHLSGVAPAADGCLVVGDDGLALSFDGTDWTVEDTGTDADLEAVVRLDEVNHVAVGADGVVLRRSVSGWRMLGSPTTNRLYDVDGLAGYFIAVGRHGTVIIGEGDALWSAESPTTGHLRAVDVLGFNDAWLAGDEGLVLRYR
jgi:hypothetical protein